MQVWASLAVLEEAGSDVEMPGGPVPSSSAAVERSVVEVTVEEASTPSKQLEVYKASAVAEGKHNTTHSPWQAGTYQSSPS